MRKVEDLTSENIEKESKKPKRKKRKPVNTGLLTGEVIQEYGRPKDLEARIKMLFMIFMPIFTSLGVSKLPNNKIRASIYHFTATLYPLQIR